MATYRSELPPIPDRMKSLPVRRGYPVPWFVPMVKGEYEFPVADARKLALAVKKKLCWVCGKPLGTFKAFVIGPMCVVNQITSEPPCHKECAIFSATACPFLTRPHMKRQLEAPEGAIPPPGMHIERNPGVSVVWVTRTFELRVVREGGVPGVLFRVGPSSEIFWYAKGKPATREEALAAMVSGKPFLLDAAQRGGADEVKDLERKFASAVNLVPA